MAKARNMIIDGYRKGVQLQIDKYGMFYIFNGRNPIDDIEVESYHILTEETSKNVTSTLGRGLIGSTLFGLVGSTAALTGKEDKIYTVKVIWDDYTEEIKRNYSIFELDADFYKVFTMKCTRTSETQQLQPTANNISDIKSKLQQLKSMYEEDLITEEEYNSKKQEFLNKM